MQKRVRLHEENRCEGMQKRLRVSEERQREQSIDKERQREQPIDQGDMSKMSFIKLKRSLHNGA